MKVLIIGSGARVHQELAMVDRASFDLVIGVNQAAIDFDTDVLVTLHPKEYANKADKPVVSYVPLDGVTKVMPFQWEGMNRTGGSASGSSGLYAVKYALSIGAKEVVLAGVGMDILPHYYGGGEWTECLRFRGAWEAVASQLRGRVTSLGGWTRELLSTVPCGESEMLCH